MAHFYGVYFKTKMRLLIFLFLNSSLFAMDTIYCQINGDLIAGALNGLKLVMGDSSFIDILKAGAIVSAFWGVLLSMYAPKGSGIGGALAFPKALITVVFIQTFWMSQTMNVYVQDAVNPNNSQIVQNVPYGSAYPVAQTTMIEHYLSQQIDKAFSLPSAINYNSSGLGTP